MVTPPRKRPDLAQVLPLWPGLVLVGGLVRLQGVAALAAHMPLVGVFALWSAAVGVAAGRAAGREGARLMASAGCLAAAGLVVAGAVEPGQVTTRGLFWLAASGLALAAGAFPWRRVAHYPRLAGLASLMLLLLPLGVGMEAGGARAWLAWRGLHAQPAEAARVLAILAAAGYLAGGGSRARVPLVAGREQLLPLGIGWVALTAALAAQRDLGGAMLLGAVLPVAWVLAGGRWPAGATVLGIAGAAALIFLFPHATARVEAWVDPWGQISGGGYQVLQGLASVRLGGLWGVGDRLTADQAVPALATDLPLAAITEGAGLFAALGILYLQWSIVDGGLRVAGRARDPLVRVLAGSAAVLWGLETLLPAAGWLGLLPLTGLPLPLVSRGGSALLAHGALLGWWLWALRVEREGDGAAAGAEG